MKLAAFPLFAALLAAGGACEKAPPPRAGDGNVLQLSLNESPVSDTTLCGPFPKLYKEIIWNWMQTNLVDPNSAKIEWEGEPQCSDQGKNGEHLYGWLVKFNVNARNRFGGYTGKQHHAALIRDGNVIKAFGFGY